MSHVEMWKLSHRSISALVIKKKWQCCYFNFGKFFLLLGKKVAGGPLLNLLYDVAIGPTWPGQGL